MNKKLSPVEGNYYFAYMEGQPYKYVMMVKKLDTCYAYGSFVATEGVRYSESGGFTLKEYTFVPATLDQINHLNKCIANGQWVPAEEIIDNFQIY